MSKHKLLLADDSVTIQKVVNLTFADEGIEVISVGDGNSAMERFVESTPDLVMVDVNMPGLDGYRICEMIKQDETTRHVPVILLVGSFEPFDEDEARRVGANDYLTKPFQSIRQLVNKVTVLLNKPEEPESIEFEETAGQAAESSAPATAESDSELGDAGMDDEMIHADQVGNLPVDDLHKLAFNDVANRESSPFDSSSYRDSSDDMDSETDSDPAKTQPFSAEELSELTAAVQRSDDEELDSGDTIPIDDRAISLENQMVSDFESEAREFASEFEIEAKAGSQSFGSDLSGNDTAETEELTGIATDHQTAAAVEESDSQTAIEYQDANEDSITSEDSNTESYVSEFESIPSEDTSEEDVSGSDFVETESESSDFEDTLPIYHVADSDEGVWEVIEPVDDQQASWETSEEPEVVPEQPTYFTDQADSEYAETDSDEDTDSWTSVETAAPEPEVETVSEETFEDEPAEVADAELVDEVETIESIQDIDSDTQYDDSFGSKTAEIPVPVETVDESSEYADTEPEFEETGQPERSRVESLVSSKDTSDSVESVIVSEFARHSVSLSSEAVEKIAGRIAEKISEKIVQQLATEVVTDLADLIVDRMEQKKLE